MNAGFGFGQENRSRQVVTLFARIVAFPVESTVSVITWFVADVLAPLTMLPGAFVDGVRAARHRHRTRLAHRMVLHEVELAVSREVAVRQVVYRDVLRALDRLDRDHARITPHFAETLAAALVVYETQVAALREIPGDPSLNARLQELLASA